MANTAVNGKLPLAVGNPNRNAASVAPPVLPLSQLVLRTCAASSTASCAASGAAPRRKGGSTRGTGGSAGSSTEASPNRIGE